MSTRTIKELKRDEGFTNRSLDAYRELFKLVEYYKSEVIQNQLEMKRATAGGDSEYLARLEGLNEAYNDNIAEVSWVLNLMHGNLEEKHGNVKEMVVAQ